ncbi:hypothetical protein BWD09_10420 [Neisseria dentiae]|uniref:Uncharacterized protein n=1 Tax=Neisseria dentiae TaxID=194197 RepID=A0A1X3D4Q7_9NEIS|nr:hypothetical protein BWD09_10420 [Neisseria dentiae]
MLLSLILLFEYHSIAFLKKKQAETFAKIPLRPSEMLKYRHSRVGGNPDGNIEALIKQILECQASGFPPTRE